eukprot:169890_1
MSCENKINSKASICFINCNENKCKESKIIPASSNLQELAIICEESHSCNNMDILLIKSKISKVTLLCTNCKSVAMAIESELSMQIYIYCDRENSEGCQGMNINLTSVQKQNIFNITIGCYKFSSCGDLTIDATNTNDNMYLTMLIYNYSQGINIIDTVYKQINFVFHPYFIEYETNKVKSREEFFQLAKDKYGGNWPLDGISITTATQECEYVTNANSYWFLEKDLPSSSDECYWLDINKLFSPNVVCVDKTHQNNEYSDLPLWIYIISGVAGFIFIAALIGFIVYYHRKKKKLNLKEQEILQEREDKAIDVSNPMVISLAIGHYHDEPSDAEFDGYVDDLNGVDRDIVNLKSLFYSELNYQMFPEYKDKFIKIEWTKKQIMDLLKEKSDLLAANIYDAQDETKQNGYDGLIFAVSSHGLKSNIITSDYKFISKKNIHRMFSVGHPRARLIPRLFIFDCCDGDEQKKGINKSRNIGKAIWKDMNVNKIDKSQTKTKVDMKDDSMSEESKSNNDSSSDTEDEGMWERGTQNPDHKLAELHAANQDFQSRLNSRIGSYLIHSFVEKTKIGLQKNSKDMPFLGEIFGEIQTDLEKSTQLPIYTWNNGTENIRLRKNKDKHVNKIKHTIDDDSNDETQSVGNDSVEMITIKATESNVNNEDGNNSDTMDENKPLTTNVLTSQEEQKETGQRQNSYALIEGN